MIFVVLAILLISLIVLPQLWVKRAIAKHAVQRSDLPGTGGELAEHLIEHFNLQAVGVERTQLGDHYDPSTRTVRLSDAHYDGTSLSAVAIAAHEVSHAIQHLHGDKLLSTRTRMAKMAIWTDRIGSAFMFVAPLLGGLAKAPAVVLLSIGVGLMMMGMRVALHLITLPVELDASFKKALPILEQGNYLHPDDLPAVRQVLKAAAFTYVAAALLSLIDVARWIRVFR